MLHHLDGVARHSAKQRNSRLILSLHCLLASSHEKVSLKQDSVKALHRNNCEPSFRLSIIIIVNAHFSPLSHIQAVIQYVDLGCHQQLPYRTPVNEL